MQTISYPISTHVKFLLYPESYFSMIKLNVLFYYAVILCCRGTHPFMANVVQTVDGRKVKTANHVRLAFHMH